MFYVLVLLWTSMCGSLLQEGVHVRLAGASTLLYTPLSVSLWMWWYYSGDV